MDAAAEFNDAVSDILRGVYTVSFAVITEEPDPKTRRVEVCLQDNEEVMADNIPVASAYAVDGAGETHPIEMGMRGILLHSKDPILEYLKTAEVLPEPVVKDYQHSINDAIFFPMFWSKDQEVPSIEQHDPEEWLYYHKSETYQRIRSMEFGDGDWEVAHNEGHRATLSLLEGVLLHHALNHEIYIREEETRLSRTDAPDIVQDPVIPEARVEGDLHVEGDLTVDGNASIGGSAEVGTDLTVGQSASVGTNLSVAEDATVEGLMDVGEGVSSLGYASDTRPEPTVDELEDGKRMLYVSDGTDDYEAGDLVSARNDAGTIVSQPIGLVADDA